MAIQELVKQFWTQFHKETWGRRDNHPMREGDLRTEPVAVSPPASDESLIPPPTTAAEISPEATGMSAIAPTAVITTQAGPNIPSTSADQQNEMSPKVDNAGRDTTSPVRVSQMDRKPSAASTGETSSTRKRYAAVYIHSSKESQRMVGPVMGDKAAHPRDSDAQNNGETEPEAMDTEASDDGQDRPSSPVVSSPARPPAGLANGSNQGALPSPSSGSLGPIPDGLHSISKNGSLETTENHAIWTPKHKPPQQTRDVGESTMIQVRRVRSIVEHSHALCSQRMIEAVDDFDAQVRTLRQQQQQRLQDIAAAEQAYSHQPDISALLGSHEATQEELIRTKAELIQVRKREREAQERCDAHAAEATLLRERLKASKDRATQLQCQLEQERQERCEAAAPPTTDQNEAEVKNLHKGLTDATAVIEQLTNCIQELEKQLKESEDRIVVRDSMLQEYFKLSAPNIPTTTAASSGWNLASGREGPAPTLESLQARWRELLRATPLAAGSLAPTAQSSSAQIAPIPQRPALLVNPVIGLTNQEQPGLISMTTVPITTATPAVTTSSGETPSNTSGMLPCIQ